MFARQALAICLASCKPCNVLAGERAGAGPASVGFGALPKTMHPRQAETNPVPDLCDPDRDSTHLH